MEGLSRTDQFAISVLDSVVTTESGQAVYCSSNRSTRVAAFGPVVPPFASQPATAAVATAPTAPPSNDQTAPPTNTCFIEGRNVSESEVTITGTGNGGTAVGRAKGKVESEMTCGSR